MTQKITNQSQAAQAAAKATELQSYRATEQFTKLNFFKHNLEFRKISVVLLLFCLLISTQLKSAIIINSGGTVTWGTGGTALPTNYETGIIIQNNALGNPTTVIINNSTLFMNPSSWGAGCNTSVSIFVDEGCQLILNGVTITLATTYPCGGNPTNTLANDVWDGIFVQGQLVNTATVDQYVTLPTSTNWAGVMRTISDGYSGANPQTYFEMNGGSITKAKIAVSSVKGGIVRVKGGATFLDNDIHCKIADYLSTNSLESNASHFMDCIFRWTRDNPTFNQYKGIYFDAIKGVRIGGCTFENNDPVLHCFDDRGTGIFSDEATFSASGSGTVFCADEMGCLENCTGTNPGTGCKFNKLSYGIFFIDNSGDENSFKAKRSDFYQNWISIYAENAYLPIISNNYFNFTRVVSPATPTVATRADYNSIFSSCTPIIAGAGTTPTSPTIEDIHLYLCKRFDVYNNTHEFADIDINHIVIEDCQSQRSRIQKNKIKNSNSSRINTNNVTGISLIVDNVTGNGDDEGLEILCNKFASMGCDIKIATGVTTKAIWSHSSTDGSKNEFSNPLFNRIAIENSGTNAIEYKYRTSTINGNPFLLNSTNVTANTLNASLGCDLTCNDFLADIKDITLKPNSINIYPNPANSIVNIESKFGTINTIQIYNFQGQLVFTKLCDKFNTTETINLPKFEQGLYMAYITLANGNIACQKLVISNK